MNLDSFSEPQRQALLDLAMLAMYADGHLASVEDERLLRLLTAMGCETPDDCGRHHDASVTRVRRRSHTVEEARGYAQELARQFTTSEQKTRVHEILGEVLSSDNRVAPQEATFLSLVREALRI